MAESNQEQTAQRFQGFDTENQTAGEPARFGYDCELPPDVLQTQPNPHERWALTDSQKTILTLTVAPIGWTITGVLAYFVSPTPSDYATTLLIQMCGIAIGWLLAFLASPRDEDEKAAFSLLTKTLSAFISGYLLSKVEPVIRAVLNSDLPKSPLSAARLLIFVTALALAFMNGYSYRLYYHFRPMEAARRKAQELQTSGDDLDNRS